MLRHVATALTAFVICACADHRVAEMTSLQGALGAAADGLALEGLQASLAWTIARIDVIDDTSAFISEHLESAVTPIDTSNDPASFTLDLSAPPPDEALNEDHHVVGVERDGARIGIAGVVLTQAGLDEAGAGIVAWNRSTWVVFVDRDIDDQSEAAARLFGGPLSAGYHLFRDRDLVVDRGACSASFASMSAEEQALYGTGPERFMQSGCWEPIDPSTVVEVNPAPRDAAAGAPVAIELVSDNDGVDVTE